MLNKFLYLFKNKTHHPKITYLSLILPWSVLQTKTYIIKILRISLDLSSLIDLSYKQTISPSFKNPLKGYQRPPVLSDFLPLLRNSITIVPLIFAHLLTISNSVWQTLIHSLILRIGRLTYIWTSSAFLCTLQFDILLCKSFTYTENSFWPTTDPWGTPRFRQRKDEYTLFRKTDCPRLLK